jgi:hypothetical protein
LIFLSGIKSGKKRRPTFCYTSFRPVFHIDCKFGSCNIVYLHVLRVVSRQWLMEPFLNRQKYIHFGSWKNIFPKRELGTPDIVGEPNGALAHRIFLWTRKNERVRAFWSWRWGSNASAERYLSQRYGGASPIVESNDWRSLSLSITTITLCQLLRY